MKAFLADRRGHAYEQWLVFKASDHQFLIAVYDSDEQRVINVRLQFFFSNLEFKNFINLPEDVASAMYSDILRAHSLYEGLLKDFNRLSHTAQSSHCNLLNGNQFSSNVTRGEQGYKDKDGEYEQNWFAIHDRYDCECMSGLFVVYDAITGKLDIRYENDLNFIKADFMTNRWRLNVCAELIERVKQYLVQTQILKTRIVDICEAKKH